MFSLTELQHQLVGFHRSPAPVAHLHQVAKIELAAKRSFTADSFLYSSTTFLSIRCIMKSIMLMLLVAATLTLSLALQIAPRLSRQRLTTASTFSRISPTKLYSTAGSTTDSAEVDNGVNFYALDSADQNVGFGDFSLMASQSETGRKYVDVETLGKEGGPKDGDVVWIRGRVSSVRAKGNACFMVVRSGVFNTVQACHFKDKENPDESKKMIKYAGALALESIVDIMGVVVAADVKSCSISNVELQIKRIYAVRRYKVYFLIFQTIVEHLFRSLMKHILI